MNENDSKKQKCLMKSNNILLNQTKTGCYAILHKPRAVSDIENQKIFKYRFNRAPAITPTTAEIVGIMIFCRDCDFFSSVEL